MSNKILNIACEDEGLITEEEIKILSEYETKG